MANIVLLSSIFLECCFIVFQFVFALVLDRLKQCDDEDLVRDSKESVPSNTKKGTRSAVKKYNEW